MEYYGVIAGAFALFVVALVSALSASIALRDEWGLRRSRTNWTALVLWTLTALVSLTGGVIVAMVADTITAPATSW